MLKSEYFDSPPKQATKLPEVELARPPKDAKGQTEKRTV